MACGGEGCGLCRAPEQEPCSPQGESGTEPSEVSPHEGVAPHWLPSRRDEDDELAPCQAAATSESRAVSGGSWSLQRRVAVLVVSAALLAGTLWCVARRGLPDGASVGPLADFGERSAGDLQSALRQLLGTPPEGRHGTPPRSLELSRHLEAPPSAPGFPAVTAANIFDDLSREIAAEGDGGGPEQPAGESGADRRHERLVTVPPAEPPAAEGGPVPLHDGSGPSPNGSYNLSGQHHNFSYNYSSELHNLSGNRSGKHQPKPKPTPPPLPTPEDITKRVENITATGAWVKYPSTNCYFLHGSGRFPNGSEGNTDGNITDLDDCMLACEADEWCEGIVVDAGKTNGSCSLRSEMVFTSCAEDEAFDTWQRGSISDHVQRLVDRHGWTRYENKNCFVGHGSAAYPKGATKTPYSSGDQAISLSECMQRCQDDPLCEAVVTSHGKDVTACELRAWVSPGDCVWSGELDLWRMDQGGQVPEGTELPSGEQGVDRLVGVADMIMGWSFSKLDFTRCALVGASGVMRGSNAGEEIDGHTAVIRLNRMPKPEFYGDFGARTDVLFLSREWSGAVAMMGGETPETRKCSDVHGCPEAAILVRGDLERCDPGHMAYTWGPTHPVVGCTHTNVSRMVATGFTTLHGLLATTGLQAFFTFLPVCGELNLYGFGGTSTADGHNEWSGGHNLKEEHHIQGKVVNGQWDDLPWRNTFKEFEWIKEHAAQTSVKVGNLE